MHCFDKRNVFVALWISDLLVNAVESSIPGFAIIFRYFPMLPHCAVRSGCPRNAIDVRLSLGCFHRFAAQHHAFPLQPARQQEAAALIINPGLVPFAGLRIVKIVTRTRVSSLRRCPVFLNDAAILQKHNAIVPQQRVGAGFVGFPVAEPEIELPKFRLAAGTGFAFLSA